MSSISDEQLQKEFRRLDKDGDGSITLAELRHYYQPMQEMLGVAPEAIERELQGFMRRVDTDQNGTINFEEFKAFCHRK